MYDLCVIEYIFRKSPWSWTIDTSVCANHRMVPNIFNFSKFTNIKNKHFSKSRERLQLTYSTLWQDSLPQQFLFCGITGKLRFPTGKLRFPTGIEEIPNDSTEAPKQIYILLEDVLNKNTYIS